jgi:hypothetical protein
VHIAQNRTRIVASPHHCHGALPQACMPRRGAGTHRYLQCSAAARPDRTQSSSCDRGRTGLPMPTPRSPLIPYGGFPVMAGRLVCQAGPPIVRLPAPAPATAGLPSPFVHPRSERLLYCAGPLMMMHRGGGRPPPQPPLVGFCCPGPSSLNRLIRPSPAHRDFTAGRGARDARCGSARRPASGSGFTTIPSYMPSSDPGVPDIACVQLRRRRPSPDLNGSALPTPQSVSRARLSASWFALATACQVARPPGRI